MISYIELLSRTIRRATGAQRMGQAKSRRLPPAESGSASLSRGAGETVAGGPYAIIPTLGTLAAANYDFTTFNNGAFTINPYTLAVTAVARSNTYGSSDPALTIHLWLAAEW